MVATASVMVTMGTFAAFTATTSLAVIALVAFLNGAVRSIGYSGLLTLVYSDVGEEQMAHGTTLAATAQQVAGGFAASVGVLALRIGRSLTHSGALSSPSAFRIAFGLLAALTLVPLMNALTLHPTAGDVLRTPSAPRTNQA